MKHRDIIKEYGNNIKRIRKFSNITLEELSEKSNINIEYLKKIENGTVDNKVALYNHIIADALNIAPNDLCKFE